MNVFELRNQVITDYRGYIESFLRISDERIRAFVGQKLNAGAYWPQPLVQLNPTFESGEAMTDLVQEGVLHPECLNIFRIKTAEKPDGPVLSLHKHQSEAIRIAARGESFCTVTGTGSGKSLTYILPVVNHILKHGSGKGIQAIIVYPMNALANSQLGELEKFLQLGYPEGQSPVTFARYTGQDINEERRQIRQNPPDILLTNFVVLELILTRPEDENILKRARGLKFLVLDELHTYRGRQGADVALLVRRLKERLEATDTVCVGTSATMSSGGTYRDQQHTVATVATRLFGSEVKPENVIGETLRRTTLPLDLSDPRNVQALHDRLLSDVPYDLDFHAFRQDPLARWIESTVGLVMKDERLARQMPQPLAGGEGLASKLAVLTGLDVQRCEEKIQECLMAGYQTINPQTKLRAFAFRLHQFISRGDTVYSTLDDPQERHLTIQAQQFMPGSDKKKVLLPLSFCRECGQEFYTVWRKAMGASSTFFTPRSLQDRYSEPEGEPGFLYMGSWPDNEQEMLERLPDDYVDLSGEERVLKRDRRKQLPEKVYFYADGQEVQEPNHNADLRVGHYLQSPFTFCPHCGVSYPGRSTSDFGKLSTLSSEGRSTATTILSLSTVQRLRKTDLSKEAQKLLSFTDNRQDASLQAGHLSDFVETSLLRAALYKALSEAGDEGIRHDHLTQRIFDALGLQMTEYASNPEVKFAQKHETEKALRDVLGYRVYRDLKRGWRVTAPNLEQVDLLRVDYVSLKELAAADEEWQGRHPALVGASAEMREEVLGILLDLMRKALAIKVEYLDKTFQERLIQRSNQYLVHPWAIDEFEKIEYASVIYARSKRQGDSREFSFLSSRSRFGQYLRKSSRLYQVYPFSVQETEDIITQLLDMLCLAGIVEKVDDQGGYQVLSSAILWRPGDGSRMPLDPLMMRVKTPSSNRINRFFREFYSLTARNLVGVRAKEHTAQVPYELRMRREEEFRAGTLPILYCSPTMELGVDISTLNVVNMRNVPPTPANYAQRSGRAGRSGQPALVFTYASTGNSHEQYYFVRSERMVHGVVHPPRIDLANEDLLKSHIHAIWLAETGANLGKTLKDILDLEGEDPTLELLPSVRDQLNHAPARHNAMRRSQQVLETLGEELLNAKWYHPNWLSQVLLQAPEMFDRACDRWRDLYRSARAQFIAANKVILDASRSSSDKQQAENLRRQAQAQIALLQDSEEGAKADFFSYRYVASEGFLPGYSFPRLPLSAFIPARRGKIGREDFLSRPRFLAITEFGPHSVLYYEGSKFLINKVILPPGSSEELQTLTIKRCEECGYLHEVNATGGPDVCQHCSHPLGVPVKSLLRMTNVGTQRRERINSDEEERVRLGYDVMTSVRFPASVNNPTQLAVQTAEVKLQGEPLASLSYAQAADIWRINLGWKRRENPNSIGFMLDQERGTWIKDRRALTYDDIDDQSTQGRKTTRVIPFVQDRKNSLLYQPSIELSNKQWATLLSALKMAIQLEFQLEDSELAGELLPDSRKPRHILLFEAAEGGAGALRQLVTDPAALGRVARQALELCHFNPNTGSDERRAKHASEDCGGACYDCLMSYQNQRDHHLLDRHAILQLLLDLAAAEVTLSPTEQPRDEHFSRLEGLCESGLERRFLRFLRDNGLALPSDAQKYIPECNTRLDFSYEKSRVAIYVDGPPHDYPERQARDEQCTDCLMWEMGYNVIRFHHEADWLEIVKAHPNIFGVTQKA